MDKSLELLKKVSEKLAELRFPEDGSGYKRERECLILVDKELEKSPNDLLLVAIKSELLQEIEKELSVKFARLVISATIADDSEKAKTARGIAYYVCAQESDRRQEYRDQDDTLKMFRLALENYPAHWNAATMFADHAYNDDKFYDEAISYLESALQGNTDQNIKLRILSQAAFISHNSNGHDLNAVKYYEECQKFEELDEHRLSRLALSYARIRQFAKAFDTFQLSRKLEVDYVNNQRKNTPHYNLVMRGSENPKLLDITCESISAYETDPTNENLIMVAMCFFQHPAALARFVLDSVRKQLTGKGEIDHIADTFGIERSSQIYDGTTNLYSEEDFERLANDAAAKIEQQINSDSK